MRDFGPFVLKERIAAGGMGAVYLAIQKSLGRPVVLKILPPGQDEYAIARFEREARSIAQVSHENIVQVIDFGIHDDTPYIVLEFVDGIDLRRVLQGHEPIPMEIGLILLRDMFLGLEHAHEKNIVHRDIKPSNLMLTPGGVLKILDFGLAGRSKGDNITIDAGTVIGTPAYMSPEQAMVGPVGERSDIFSAGVVAYELLSGIRPFRGNQVPAIINSMLNEKPTPLRVVNPRVPREIHNLVHSMLEKDPIARCSSIRDARVQVEKALLVLGVTSPREMLREYVASLDLGSKSLSAEAPVYGSEVLKTGARSQGFPELKAARVRRSALAIISAVVLLIAVPLLLFVPLRPVSPEGRAVVAALALGGSLSFLLYYLSRSRARKSELVEMTMLVPSATEWASVARIQHVASPEVLNDSTQEIALSELRDPEVALLQKSIDLDAVTDAETPRSPEPAVRSEAATTAEFPTAVLVVSASESVTIGSRFEISKSPFVIGRAQECDIGLEFDPRASRKHAEITYVASAYWIEDLASSNGTWLDGRRVRGRMPIMHGATINIGSCAFSFTIADPEDLPSLIDTVVQDRFVLKRLIRRTARSLTFEADDRRLPKKVVTKILAPQLGSFPHYIETFRREASTAARLSHPHIARTIDSGAFCSVLGSGREVTLEYYCVEMFDGGSLMDLLARNESPPLDLVAKWLSEVSDAASHAHRQGIVHGGIKPSAILLDGENNAYLTDFAFATRVGETGGSTLLGVPAYLAPEQWEGSPIEYAADQYSLAVLAYLLVGGTLPFDGQEREDVRRRNFARGPVPVHLEAIRLGRAGVGRSVSPVLARALATDPGQRFPSIQEFATSVRKCLSRPDLTADRPRVFVSYRRDSGAGWANLIAHELKQKHGVEAFVDTQRVDSVGRFPVRIRQAIEDCDVFICLLSANTLQSRYVADEIAVAHSCGKPMIPVLQESFRPEAYRDSQQPHLDELLAHDGVHLLDERNIHVSYTIEEIARLVRTTTGGEATPIN